MRGMLGQRLWVRWCGRNLVQLLLKLIKKNRHKRLVFLVLGLVSCVGVTVTFKDTMHFQNIQNMAATYSAMVMSGAGQGIREVFRRRQVSSVGSPQCMDSYAGSYGRLEDIFCMRLPKFVENLTNPCYYDTLYNGTRALRCLPYFFLVGIDKSGTTDLTGRIQNHPDIRGNNGSLRKETMYWSWYKYGFFNKNMGGHKRNFSWYVNHFSNTAYEIEHSKHPNRTQVITGDATPMDLWDFRGWPMIPQNRGLKEPKVLTPHFLQYIYGEFLPKFFIQLREPVERLYSDYIFLDMGKNEKEFHNSAVAALDMMQQCERKHSRRWCFYNQDMYQKLPARIHISCYSVYLAEWFRVFPREAFHVTRIDDFQHQMGEVLTSVFNFMGIRQPPDDVMKQMLTQERRHVTKAKNTTVLPETRKALKAYYDKCNNETAQLLQDDRYLWRDHVV